MTDKELEQIYNEAYKAVYWTALSLLKSDACAEDIVQDTFVAFIESYSNITDTSKATALLKKIAANKCLDFIKLSRTDNADEEFFENVEAVPEDFLPDTIIESDEMCKIIMDIIETTLSEDIRRTLILFYFDEMSTKEIAKALDVPEGTVRRRLNFARNKIKKEVEKYEKENGTKLFGMAPLPFLSKLFMKEAEKVPFKAMSASFASILSASKKASQAGAKFAATAAKKGTEEMVKKVVIGSVIGVVAVGATAGIIIASVQRKNTQSPVMADHTEATTVVETDSTTPSSDNIIADVTDATDATDATVASEDTAETTTGKPITDESIFIAMSGMSDDEIIENVWKTSDVYVGMTKADYEANLIYGDDMKVVSTGGNFVWQFLSQKNDEDIYISQFAIIGANEGSGENAAITGFNDIACSDVAFYVNDEERAKSIVDKLIEKFETEGYSISIDEEINGSRIVKLNGIASIKLAGFAGKYVVSVQIPIEG